MAGTFGRKADTLSLMTLQMLLWATLPELSKTREAFWMAVPSLRRSKQQWVGKGGAMSATCSKGSLQGILLAPTPTCSSPRTDP